MKPFKISETQILRKFKGFHDQLQKVPVDVNFWNLNLAQRLWHVTLRIFSLSLSGYLDHKNNCSIQN